jgi:hypothetical protein
MLCVQVLEQLVTKLLAQMPLLLRMLDNIALLDMLLSFFQAVTGKPSPWAVASLLERPCLVPHVPVLLVGMHYGGYDCFSSEAQA